MVESRRRISVGGGAPAWLRTDVLMEPFGGDVERYRQFVEVDLPSDEPTAMLPVCVPTCADVENAVTELFGVHLDDLRRPTPGAPNDRSRARAISLCVELRVATTAELARAIRVEQPIERPDDRSARQGARSPQIRRRRRSDAGRWPASVAANLQRSVPDPGVAGSAGAVDVSGDEVLELLLLAAGTDDLRVVGEGTLVQ